MSVGTQGEFFDRPEPAATVVEELNAISQPRIDLPNSGKRGMKDLSIPKLYYSISEVSRLTGLEQYVLRYWETEFDDLRPQKNRAGNRIYSNKDIKLILRLKELVRDQRYTIEGAKQIVKEDRANEKAAAIAAAEEHATVKDPAQIAIQSETKKEKIAAPVALLSLEDIQVMRSSLLELKAVLK